MSVQVRDSAIASDRPQDDVAAADEQRRLTLARANEQIRWFNKHADKDRLGYRSIKLAQIVLSAGVPLAAATQSDSAGSAYFTGALGGLVVVLEGVQQLFGFHEGWFRYRSTDRALVSERQLFLAGAGDYAASATPTQLFAQRVESLISNEVNAWAKTQQDEPSRRV